MTGLDVKSSNVISADLLVQRLLHFTEVGHCAKQDNFLKIHLQDFIRVALSLKIQSME